MVQFSFNATQYAPRYSGSDGLPPGKHIVHIVESSFVPTKNSTPTDPRSMLVFKMEAIGGPAAGGKQTDRLNLQNPNQQTVNIANGQLAAYCAVCGNQGFGQTEELHHIPFMIEVGPQKSNPEYTEVKGVYFADGRDAASGAAPQAHVAQGFPAAGTFAPQAQQAPAPVQAPFNGQPFAQSQPAAFPMVTGQSAPATGVPLSQQAAAAPPWARR